MHLMKLHAEKSKNILFTTLKRNGFNAKNVYAKRQIRNNSKSAPISGGKLFDTAANVCINTRMYMRMRTFT